MKTGNHKFTEIQHLKDSKHTWRHLLGYGTTLYDFVIGLLVGATLIGILSTFGFHIELWPTYVIIGIFGFIYLASNLTSMHEHYHLEQSKEKKLVDIIKDEDLENWEMTLNQLPAELFDKDPINQQTSLEEYVTERSIDDLQNDISRRYQKILRQLNAILTRPAPTDPTKATALKDAKIRAAHLLNTLEKKILWLSQIEKNQATANQLRQLIGQKPLPEPEKKQRGFFGRSFHWMAKFNQTIFYASCSGLYVYGQYFSGYAIPALLSWAGIFIFSVIILGGAFGLILDSIPTARKTHLEQIKNTKIQLQSKLRLMQFSVNSFEALADLKEIRQDLRDNIVTPQNAELLKTKTKSKSKYQFIEIDRVKRKSWLSYLYLDRGIEWFLAAYSGFGSGAAMYTLLPSALAIIPWLSLTLSIGLGLYYTLFRESQIRAMKSRETHLINNLYRTLRDSKADIWRYDMQTFSLEACKDEDGKKISLEKYIKRSKPQQLYVDLKNKYLTLQGRVTNFYKLKKKLVGKQIKKAYQIHQEKIERLVEQLNTSLSLHSSNMKKKEIANLVQYDLLGKPLQKKPKKPWLNSINNLFKFLGEFAGSNYQTFLDGATLGSSIVAIYLISSGYANILTLAASAMWLCGTFLGCGIIYLAIKLMIMESNEGYHKILREARNDIKTKSELMDSQLQNDQTQLKILDLVDSFTQIKKQMADGESPPKPDNDPDLGPSFSSEGSTPKCHSFNRSTLKTLRRNFNEFMAEVAVEDDHPYKVDRTHSIN